jgi:hypothetical protein
MKPLQREAPVGERAVAVMELRANGKEHRKWRSRDGKQLLLYLWYYDTVVKA